MPPIDQNGSSTGGFEYIAHGATIDDIADTLGAQFGRSVIDKTGLTGKYDFRMKAYGTFAGDRKVDDANPLPALDAAIHDDLGLKIVPSRGPIPVLVVDHVEMPSAN